MKISARVVYPYYEGNDHISAAHIFPVYFPIHMKNWRAGRTHLQLSDHPKHRKLIETNTKKAGM